VSKKKVAIVGGGLAGLTAAYRLVEADYEVDVYEKRPILGGKWSAWQDEDGDWIETGLHVFFGAYQDIFELMKELNIYDNIHWKEHALTYTLSKGERFSFKTAKLPSPLHLLPAVFENHYFSWSDKLSLAKSLSTMLFCSQKYLHEQDNVTYQYWHRSVGISDKMLKKMFLPMTLALKFLPPELISAKIVLDVTSTFLRQNDASKIGFLKGDPDTYLTSPIAQAIRDKGGRIHTNSKLLEVKLNEDLTIDSLLFEDEQKQADNYLFALPIHNLKKLMPEKWLAHDYFQGLANIESVPVITLHLWLDRQVSGIDNILFCPDARIPVYADMGNTTETYKRDDKSRFQFVIAPAFDLIEKSDQEIIDLTWEAVKDMFPETSQDAQIEKAKVVRVPQSVYYPAPGIDKFRVSQKSPIEGVYLAGGYTKQRFYDSMEGAVSSGNLAARSIMHG